MTNKQISNFKLLGYWVICLLVVLVVFPKNVAASGLSLAISPPILQIVAIPPAEVKTSVTVQNVSENTLVLEAVFKPFTQDKENGTVRYLPEDESYSALFKKIQLLDGSSPVHSLELGPGQSKKLDVSIPVGAADIQTDYYFSIIFVSQAGEGTTDTSTAQAQGGVATNVLLTIAKDAKAHGELVEFSVPFLFEKGPIPFTVRVKNTSPHVIAPKGVILIKNMFNQTVGKVDLLPVNILSHTIRAFPDSLQSPDATDSAEILNSQFSILNSPKAIWPEKVLFGHYTATLTLALSENGPVFTRTVHFLVLPIQAIIGFFVASLISLIVWERVRRRMG